LSASVVITNYNRAKYLANTLGTWFRRECYMIYVIGAPADKVVARASTAKEPVPVFYEADAPLAISCYNVWCPCARHTCLCPRNGVPALPANEHALLLVVEILRDGYRKTRTAMRITKNRRQISNLHYWIRFGEKALLYADKSKESLLESPSFKSIDQLYSVSKAYSSLIQEARNLYAIIRGEEND